MPLLSVSHSYVAMFCASFPLAPLAALANNAFEGRLDAHKFLVFRRGFGEEAANIGVWFGILQVCIGLSLATYM